MPLTVVAVMVCVLAPGSWTLGADGLAAQGIRGTATHTGFYARMRPLVQDTVDRSLVTELGPVSFEWQGLPIYCQGVDCIRFRAGDPESTVSGSIDGSFTAWGLGVRGLSTTVAFRVRERAGGDLLWPRTDDRGDVFLAYVQWAGSSLRARAGRQRILGGLGRSAFDGGSLLWQPGGGWALEAYGGRATARAIAEPRNDALRSLESFLPDQDAYLFGGSARARLNGDVDVTVRYQREIWSDRSGLVSERGSLDLNAYPFGAFRLEASADWDFAFGRVGKAHATALVPLGGRTWMLEASARRYLPYFELWTIWGFFSPVPYHEGQLRLNWTPSGTTSVWLSGAYREYGETSTTQVLRPLQSTGRRITGGFRWNPVRRLGLGGEGRLEGNAGAYYSGADLNATVEISPDLRLSIGGTAFQQFQEFRLGEGTAIGSSASLDARLPSNLHLTAGVSLLRLAREGWGMDSDWNQVRGFWSLAVPIGDDPGLARNGAAR